MARGRARDSRRISTAVRVPMAFRSRISRIRRLANRRGEPDRRSVKADGCESHDDRRVQVRHRATENLFRTAPRSPRLSGNQEEHRGALRCAYPEVCRMFPDREDRQEISNTKLGYAVLITTVARSFPTRRVRSIAGSRATREWRTRITSSRRTGRVRAGRLMHGAIDDDRRRFLSIAAAVIAGAGRCPDHRNARRRVRPPKQIDAVS